MPFLVRHLWLTAFLLLAIVQPRTSAGLTLNAAEFGNSFLGVGCDGFTLPGGATESIRYTDTAPISNPLDLSGTNPLGATSFNATATTTVSPPAVGSVVPASTASISTSFGNVQWDQGGGGIECYGQTHATVSFEIGIVAPAGVSDPVPLIIEATGFAQVMGQPGSEQDISATASLSVRVFDEDDDVVSSETLGVARVNCSADAGDDPCDPVTPVTDTFDGMYTVFLYPDEYLLISQRAGGALSGSIALWNPPAVGQYEAFVDPKIYIDPTYLIDVEGVPTPASSVYVLEVSPGFTVVPIPPALPLLASAIAWLALMRRRRDHA